MNKYRLLLLAAFSFLFYACQNEIQPITITPPIAPLIEPSPANETTAKPENLSPPTFTSIPENSAGAMLPMITPTASITPSPTQLPATLADSLTLKPVIEGAFQKPLYLTHANDDRLFVIEQAGVVKIIEAGNLQETPFLDIRNRVGSNSFEQGLLSIAFHPNFPDDNRLFAYYTDLQGDTYISSFVVRPDNQNLADANSEIKLLSVSQPYANHNGGQLAFGPDGYLYAGFGDGGRANDPLNNGQNPNTLLGTIIRIDINFSQNGYSVPSTNPFLGDDKRRNEIWAWGLRNPWRFSFDRLNGDLFISDVGQNIWEELNFQAAQSSGGENYGWNIFEGNHCFSQTNCDSSGLVMPIFEYDHQGHCSITGGYVYRGQQFAQLSGNYFVADYCSGNIWAIVKNEDGSWTNKSILDTQLVISSFGQDVNGELYVLDYKNGSVYQLQP